MDWRQLDKDPAYQALKDARAAQLANYRLAYKRYQQKLKQIERAKEKASTELHFAMEAQQAALRACNDYYHACGGPQP